MGPGTLFLNSGVFFPYGKFIFSNRQGGVCTLNWPFDSKTGRLKNFGITQLKRIARTVT